MRTTTTMMMVMIVEIYMSVDLTFESCECRNIQTSYTCRRHPQTIESTSMFASVCPLQSYVALHGDGSSWYLGHGWKEGDGERVAST